MHYHIFWGAKGNKEPSIMNFSDSNEAMEKFIDVCKTCKIEEQSPKQDKIILSDKITFIRLESLQFRLCFVSCKENCSSENPPVFALS